MFLRGKNVLVKLIKKNTAVSKKFGCCVYCQSKQKEIKREREKKKSFFPNLSATIRAPSCALSISHLLRWWTSQVTLSFQSMYIKPLSAHPNPNPPLMICPCAAQKKISNTLKCNRPSCSRTHRIHRVHRHEPTWRPNSEAIDCPLGRECWGTTDIFSLQLDEQPVTL